MAHVRCLWQFFEFFYSCIFCSFWQETSPRLPCYYFLWHLVYSEDRVSHGKYTRADAPSVYGTASEKLGLSSLFLKQGDLYYESNLCLVWKMETIYRSRRVGTSEIVPFTLPPKPSLPTSTPEPRFLLFLQCLHTHTQMHTPLFFIITILIARFCRSRKHNYHQSLQNSLSKLVLTIKFPLACPSSWWLI